MNKPHLLWLPSEARSQRPSQIHAIQVPQLMFHPADACFIVERSGHRQFRTSQRTGVTGRLTSKRVKELEEPVSGEIGGIGGP
jgi:hypothetical protein